MRAFTGNEDPKALFEELHRLLDRAGELLLKARAEHEKAMSFIAAILPDEPSAEDLRAAINAYKEGRVRPLPPFDDSVRKDPEPLIVTETGQVVRSTRPVPRSIECFAGVLPQGCAAHHRSAHAYRNDEAADVRDRWEDVPAYRHRSTNAYLARIHCCNRVSCSAVASHWMP